MSVSSIKHVIFVSALPLAFAASPVGRWGHQAVYVPAQQAMYVVGGQVSSSGSKITNDVLVLPLNQSSPSFSAGPNDALPPHAFAAATLSEGGDSLMVIGGMTSSCSSDAIAHTLALDGSTTTWTHSNPSSLVRRRGAAAEWTDNGSANGQVLLVGGVADTYSCSTGTYTYPATDLLDIPLSDSALRSSTNLPTGLTGPDLAVSDFAFTRASDGTLYMIGGQDANGRAISLGTIGKWTSGGGWVSQKTSGAAPSERTGASLVAHPTLDLLILHGGETNNAPSSTLAFLNTTSWAWSVPHSLQPPASSATAYHSSIMTPHGVMITSFGLGPSGSPSSNVFYLDMRDPTQSAWSWKSQWSQDMLQAYSAPTDKTNDTITGVADNATSGGSDKKKVTSIVVPVLIGALILIPLAIFFIRRKVRRDKKRREARHFSFEDEGDFRSTTSLPAGRVTRTQYGFGTDANEREGNLFSDAMGALKRLSTRRRSVDSVSTTGEREMEQVNNGRVSRLDERTMRWEEIDFGLGQVDEKNRDSRQGSLAGPPGVASTVTAADPFADPAPLIRFDSHDSSDHIGTPLNDGQQPLIPSVTVQPPTVPPTPASGITASGPAFSPSAADGLDWNMLAQEMQVRPAFRSISPNSTLRSHAHPDAPTIIPARSTSPAAAMADDDSLPYLRSASPTSYAPALAPGRPPTAPVQSSSPGGNRPPRLPSLEFQRHVMFDPVQPHPQARRASDVPAAHPRAVSQPISSRHLAGGQARRGSAPMTNLAPALVSPTSSGSATPTQRSPRALPSTPMQTPARRASNPVATPGTFGTTSPRSPRSPTAGSPGLGSPLMLNDKRASTMSRLRVMNMTDEDEASVESGEAL